MPQSSVASSRVDWRREQVGIFISFVIFIYARTMNIRTDSSKKKNYDKVAKQLFYMILIKKVSET